MNSLIVYAHPEPHSFNSALKECAAATLRDAGHAVEISDLYAMNFKAVADSRDFPDRICPERLNYAAEQGAAHQRGLVDPEIAREQQKLRRADLVLFQFPLWWYSTPAILKGWLERVLSAGFAYQPGKLFDQAGLAGTRAMLSFTTNGHEDSYTSAGWHGPISNTLTPMHQGLSFVGFEVLPPFIAFNVHRCSQQTREDYLDRLVQRLRKINELSPIRFPKMTEFDEAGRRRPGDEAIEP